MKRLPAFLLATLPAFALAAVNVNTAQQSELERVKGLDKVKAKSIIEWRAANGSIDNFTELQLVPGFTPELIDRLKAELAFEGDPYVPPKKEPKKKPAPVTPAPRVQASR
jgi:competence protein ComEA